MPGRIRSPGYRLCMAVGLVLSLAVLAPIAAVLWRLAGTEELFATIGRIMGGAPFQTALGRTVIIGVLAAGGSTILAAGLAWLTYRTDLPFRRMISAMVFVPFFIPLVVTALAWSLLSAESSGLINQLLRAIGIPILLNVYSVPGIIFVLAIGLMPVAYFFLRDAFAEPATEQEEAALVSGATPLTITALITLPRILPTIGATYLVILVLAAANFSVPGVLGLSRRIDVLSTQIYVAMHSYPVSYPRVATVALTLVVLLVGLLVLQQRLESRARVSSQTANRGEPIIWQLGAWRWPCFVVVAMFFVITLVLPLGAIFLTALLPFPGAPLEGFSLKNFERVFDSTVFQISIYNTLLFSFVGATIAVTVGTLAAYVFRRLRPPGAALWDVISSAPIALPGIVIGLGYLWIAVGGSFYGTLALTTLVVAVRFIPFALRSGTAALTRIDPSLDEAGRISGAGEGSVFGRIVLPNLRASIFSMWLLLFVLFTHEVDTNVLLQGTDNAVLSVQIYGWYEYGGLDLAAAGSVILLLMTAAIFFPTTVLVIWRKSLRSKRLA